MITELKTAYAIQLEQARKLMAEKGIEALRNPHALTGRICKCGNCFCCAALQVEIEAHQIGRYELNPFDGSLSGVMKTCSHSGSTLADLLSGRSLERQ